MSREQRTRPGQHAEHGAALGGGGVDALFEHFEADAALTEFGAEGDQVQHRPSEPGEYQDVVLA